MTSRKQAKREKRARQQWADDLRWLMEAPQGRRIVQNLLDRGAYGQNVFTGNSHGNFLQGRQALANELAAEIKLIALEGFHRMELEARSAQQFAEQEQSLPDEDEAE